MLILNFADSSSGIGALGFSGSDFVVQLITFVLAYLVLRRWAFGPIIRIMRERRDTIDKGVALGEQLEKEKAELEVKVDKLLSQARVQADQVIAEAKATARQTISEAEHAARKKSDGIVDDAQVRIDQEAARARAKLEQDLVGLIADATEAIIDEKVDARKDAKLISRALKERVRL